MHISLHVKLLPNPVLLSSNLYDTSVIDAIITTDLCVHAFHYTREDINAKCTQYCKLILAPA